MTRQSPCEGSMPCTFVNGTLTHDIWDERDDSFTCASSRIGYAGVSPAFAELTTTRITPSNGFLSCRAMNCTRVTFHETASAGSVGLKYWAHHRSHSTVYVLIVPPGASSWAINNISGDSSPPPLVGGSIDCTRYARSNVRTSSATVSGAASLYVRTSGPPGTPDQA